MLFLAVFNIKKSSCVLRGEDIRWNTKSTIFRKCFLNAQNLYFFTSFYLNFIENDQKLSFELKKLKFLIFGLFFIFSLKCGIAEVGVLKILYLEIGLTDFESKTRFRNVIRLLIIIN
jgi:hypothetical protein